MSNVLFLLNYLTFGLLSHSYNKSSESVTSDLPSFVPIDSSQRMARHHRPMTVQVERCALGITGQFIERTHLITQRDEEWRASDFVRLVHSKLIFGLHC